MGLVRIKGLKSGRYLAINENGTLYSKRKQKKSAMFCPKHILQCIAFTVYDVKASEVYCCCSIRSSSRSELNGLPVRVRNACQNLRLNTGIDPDPDWSREQ
ncbi:hypothetical protein AC249_AIPGENE1775 [Exaiptasia diaphana]|nr:hypothetical protein AC249_AIPGENE1775 [Exaiptasia diaphana]